jgi:hypothetical protein
LRTVATEKKAVKNRVSPPTNPAEKPTFFSPERCMTIAAARTHIFAATALPTRKHTGSSLDPPPQEVLPTGAPNTREGWNVPRSRKPAIAIVPAFWEDHFNAIVFSLDEIGKFKVHRATI